MSEDPTGSELIVNVVRAAMEWRKQFGEFGPLGPDSPHEDLAESVDALRAALTADTWEQVCWGQVKAGDRVRLPAGDGYAEADVESATELKWIGSGAHQVKIKLAGRDQLYTMRASGRVEVLSRVNLLSPEQWAQDALRILRQAFGDVKPIRPVGQESIS